MSVVIALAISIALMFGILAYLVGSLVLSIRREKGVSTLRQAWKNFGLSIAFSLMFFGAWVGQIIAEWQVFVDELQGIEKEVDEIKWAA